MFETICTHALQYAYDNDGYKFELEMTNKRNKPSVRFLVKTPEKQQPHDICSTTAGGERDVLALALRFVLLEVSGNQGFMWLDEPFKRLKECHETICRMIDFMKETQKDTKRQLVIITHTQELVDACDNPIVLKK
jgi:DNA repair exonuclease SbcCD ATPase subunit